MDEKNTIDIGNMLMNSEGTCPACGRTVTVLEGLFSAREAGIEDISVCRCPQCGHVYRYELNGGKLIFSEDVSDRFADKSQEAEVKAAEETPAEPAAQEPEAKPKKKTRKKKKAEEAPIEIPLEEPQLTETAAPAEEAFPLPPQMPQVSAEEDEEVQEIIEEFKFSSAKP
ncbi:MAG: hypothetical protein K6A14_02405, partial [Erysipelotrichaceae bacterium]|nr:hypothetical protein [Erysipelotrichaceae bacterium]